jgi:Tfp pilus assembly protein PilF
MKCFRAVAVLAICDLCACAQPTPAPSNPASIIETPGTYSVVSQPDTSSAEANFLAGVLFQKSGNPQLALEAYEKACTKSPDNVEYLLARERVMIELGQTEDAITLLREKLETFNQDAIIRREIGLLLMREERYSQAADTFKAAVALAPDDLSLCENWGIALYFAGRFSQAAEVLTAVTQAPAYADRSDLLAALGESQLQKGQTGDAAATLARVVELNPDSADAWLSLAAAQIQSGNLASARESLRKCLQLDQEDTGLTRQVMTAIDPNE